MDTLGSNPPEKILDLGTGSGAILLALLSEYPAAQGLGIDQSAETLDAAATNAAALGLAPRAQFAMGDWMNGLTERFDLIVSNPPYIPTKDLRNLKRNVRAFDDALALDGGLNMVVTHISVIPTG